MIFFIGQWHVIYLPYAWESSAFYLSVSLEENQAVDEKLGMKLLITFGICFDYDKDKIFLLKLNYTLNFIEMQCNLTF